MIKKSLAVLLLVTFTSTQLAWAGGNDLLIQDASHSLQTAQAAVAAQAETQPAAPDFSANQASDEFLQGIFPLSNVEDSLLEMTEQNYEYERYAFDDALDLLRPEYASAVILESLKPEDLRALTGLSFETGIAVIEGEIVLFTSGDRGEIRMLEPARRLLEAASFISHVHVNQKAQTGPSAFDLDFAVEVPAEEYVITQNGVYGYNRAGLQNNGKPYSYKEYLDRLNLSKDPRLTSCGDDKQNCAEPRNGAETNTRQVQARAKLNEFIAAMDRANEAGAARETFRASDIILEAESMQTQGGTWNGGTYQNVWGDGKLKKNYQVQESGIYEIEIIALANEAGQPAPEMNVMIDGAMTGSSVQITNNNWNYKSYRMSLELTAGNHEIGLGAYASLGGQSISIDKVILRKTGELSNETARIAATAVNMQASGGAWNGGDYISLWGNGELHQIQNIAQSGIYEIEVIAVGGDNGVSPPPSLKLMSGGVMAGDPIEIGNTNWNYKGRKSSRIELTAGNHDLGIGVYSKLDGQFLGVKGIVLRKVGEISYESTRTAIPSTGMQASGGTWNGAGYVTLWGNGELHQTHNIQEPGIYEIEVVAVGGDGGSAPPPSLKIMTDGIMTGSEVTIPNSNWNYKGHKTARVELSAGNHDIGVGVYSKLDNQFLGVKEIILRKVDEIKYESAKKTTQAAGMQASGGTWNGGSYTTLWGDGELRKTENIQESGIYEIEVIAAGNDAGLAPPPSFKVMAGGVMIGSEVTIPNSHWNYQGRRTARFELSAGLHDLSLGVYSHQPGQSLGVKGIILRKVGEIAFESAKKTAEAVTMQAIGGTWSSGQYISLWGDGELRQTQTLQESGVYEIEITAFGSDAGIAPAPSLKVMAGGVMIGSEVTITNSNWNYKTYKTTAKVELSAGSHDLSLGVYSKLDGQFLGVKGMTLRKIGEIEYESAVKKAEAVTMQASGGTWNGGDYVSLWGNGELRQTQTLQESGIYEIEVIAVGGDGGSTPPPSLKVMADGAMIGGEVSITNSNWSYRGYKTARVELTAGTHDLSLGVYSKLDNQFLGVKGIVLRKVGEIAYETARKTIGAAGMQASGGTWNGGDYVSMWGNGELHQAQNIQEAGIYEIEVIGMSNETGTNPLPQIKVLVDGAIQGEPLEIANSRWNYQGRRVSGIALEAGSHNIGLGLYSSLPGQSVGIKGIVLRKIGEMPFPSAAVSADAQTLQASGDHWNGGSYISVWGNGRLQLPENIHESGLYEIEIEASGAPNGQTPDPSLMVFVDGIAQGNSIEIPSNLWNYKSFKISGVRIGEGAHSLSAGMASALPGQWIGIQKITARKIAELPEAGLPNLPAGDEIILNADRSTAAYQYADHSEIRYLRDASNRLLLTDSAGNPVETIDRPSPAPLSDLALSFQLENGITAFYEEDQLLEFRTAEGVRITDFLMTPLHEIKDALVSYPDGTREIIRNGVVIRKIFADGTVCDFRPDGVLVREITSQAVQYFTSNRVFTLDGAFALYDEHGILRETRDPNGKHFVFTREETPDSFILSLDRFASSVPSPQSMVSAVYTRGGALKKVTLQNRQQIYFDGGRIVRITDAQGQQVHYSYEETESLLNGLQVTRGGSEFNYDASGFLESITTANGVIRRSQNGDEIELLLESVGGNKLSDFELDSEGRILRGIIETKEGIKQTIENGVLTGFQTVDGRIYDYADHEAVLKEWNFKDGTRVIYGGGSISEILFPDGRRLHTIGFSADKKIESYTEELSDGTKKVFVEESLVELITPAGVHLFYGRDGMAERILLPDSSEEKIIYQRNASGALESLTFQGEHTARTFLPDGTLLSLLSGGVSAEIENGQVAHLATRFADVETPVFNAQGILSGEVNFSDETKQTIVNGELTETLRSNGTRIEYQNGKIAAITIQGKRYEFVYAESGSGSLQSAGIRLTFKPGSPVYPLVPYLLSPSETMDGASFYQDDKANYLAQAAIDTSDFKSGTGSLALDGVDDFLEFQDGTVSNPDFNYGAEDFSIDFWFKPEMHGSGQQRLWSQYTTGPGTNAVSIYMENGKLGSYIERNGQTWTNRLDGVTQVELGVWHHAVLVRSGSTLRLFLDDHLEASAPASGEFPSGPFYINAGVTMSGSGYTHQFKGRMDEILVTKGSRTVLQMHFNPLPEISAVDKELAALFLSSPLHNAFVPGKIQTQFDAGTAFYSKFSNDPARGQVYQFGTSELPTWEVENMPAGLNSGYIFRQVTVDAGDHQPSLTTALIDINGDGLPDRILEPDSGTAPYWFVQLNNGLSFDPPVKWTGVERRFDSHSSILAMGHGAIEFYAGRRPYLTGAFADINGDNRPDRILQRYDSRAWQVQINNGHGFDSMREWDDFVEPATTWSPGESSAPQIWDDTGYKEVQEMVSRLIDMDGDGLADRILRPPVAPYTHWFFQKNNGNGFDDTVLWRGLDLTFNSDPKMGGSIVWYQLDDVGMADLADLVDMNGDKRPDRLLVKLKNPADSASGYDWYIQWNNGQSFDLPVLWDSSVRNLAGPWNKSSGTALRVFDYYSNEGKRGILSDLRDVNGDGLPDRITIDNYTITGSNYTARNTWWVEINTGTTFAPAVAWTGIEGANAAETAISHDTWHRRAFGGDGYGREPSGTVDGVSDLIDLNGDKIPDRLFFKQGESEWYVQYGTGSGFLPAQEMFIKGLAAGTQAINTSRYGYLHVSLRADSAVTPAQGHVKVTLSDPSNPNAGQEWIVPSVTSDWQDFYLPIDPAKANATEVKINYAPANQAAPVQIPIHAGNVTFADMRPAATKDWLDRVLTEENILSEIHSERTQTLAQFLGLTQADAEVPAFDWNQLLMVENKIRFTSQGEADRFETLYGTVSKVENGRVTESTLPDGSKITFSEESSNAVTQNITTASGAVETVRLSYGRVREVARPGKAPLQYSYEFTPAGDEVTVVLDPDTDVTERYRGERLLSRTEANGVVTSYEYDAAGNAVRSAISYKGRVRQSFEYSTSASGNKTITTQEGVREEYAADGKITAHTTPDGYRYIHAIERPRKAVTTYEVQETTLPNGTVFRVDIPKVEFEDDPNGEEVHRVSLAGFRAPSGEDASYENGKLKGLLLTEGTRISFDQSEIVETLDPETGEMTREIELVDASIFHPDGTVTEFQNGKPFAVVSASGRVISLAREKGELVNGNESAAFHEKQAETLWNDLVLPKWKDFQPAHTLAVQTEYSMDGKMVTRQFAEGVIEIYTDGRIQATLDPKGEKLMEYSYDAEGNPVRIELGASRRRLEASVLKLRAEIAVERQKALAVVAAREQVLNQIIEGQYIAARDRLLAMRAQIQNEANNLASFPAKGKKAKNAISDAMGMIQSGLSQVDAALEQLARQRADALKQLSDEVREVSDQIETQTSEAYTRVETENQKSRKAILKQEISPVVYHWYRKVLGRDPSDAELNMILDGADYTAGTFDLEDLKNDLLDAPELIQRTAQVAAIKNRVQTQLLEYVAMTQANQSIFADSLGISSSEVVGVNSAEAASILEWLMAGSLHFGQSAYLALEALLAQAGISFDRLELASRLILIDILTGVITPLETGDLVISIYALNRVAAFYGLNAEGYRLDYETLKTTYEQECPPNAPSPCNFKLVAHINGNHFIIIKRVTANEVTYLDPGAGPEQSLDERTVSKDAFLATWVSSLNLDGTSTAPAGAVSAAPQGFGYIFSTRAPPAAAPETSYKKLTTAESMKVRGAFFPLIAFVAIAIANAVVAAISATIAAISAIISGLVAGIGSFIGGIGSFFGNIFVGNIFGALQGLFGGILQGIGQIAGGLLHGILNFGTTFMHSFGALQAGTLTPLQALTGATGLFGTGLTGTALVNNTILVGAFGLGLQGAGNLLQVAGVSPKITQTLVAGGKIAVGVAMLATGNPLGIAASIGLVAGGTSEMLSLHTSLSPAVTNILGITAAAAGAFAGAGFDAGSLTGAISGFKTALPFLAKDFASAGLVAAGSALGLDPRLTSLISIPVRAAVGGLTESLVNSNGGGGPGGLFNAVKDALISRETLVSGLSVGAEALGEKIGIDPVVTSLGMTALSGAFEGFLKSGFNGVYSGVIGAYDRAVQSMLQPENLFDFSSAVLTHGLANALESHAPSIFYRSSVESMINSAGSISAYIQNVFTNNQAISTEIDGQDALQIPLNADGSEYLIVSADKKNILARSFPGLYEEGIYKVGPNGEVTLYDGFQSFDNTDGSFAVGRKKNGYYSEFSLFSEDRDIRISGYGNNPIEIANTPTKLVVLNGVVEDLRSGRSIRYENGYEVESVIFSTSFRLKYDASLTEYIPTYEEEFIHERYSETGNLLDYRLLKEDPFKNAPDLEGGDPPDPPNNFGSLGAPATSEIVRILQEHGYTVGPDGKITKGGRAVSLDVVMIPGQQGLGGSVLGGAVVGGPEGVMLLASAAPGAPNQSTQTQVVFKANQDNDDDPNNNPFSSLMQKLKNGIKNLYNDKKIKEHGGSQELIDAADAEDRNNLTKAGRALQKHSSREGSAFQTNATTASEYNAEGKQFAEGIISNKAEVKDNRYGGIDIISQDGKGIRYDSHGQMMGFLEP